VTNPLKNDCENANTLAHVGIHLVVLALCKGEELEVEKEKRRGTGPWQQSDRTLDVESSS
jgi:hypothetical protein